MAVTNDTLGLAIAGGALVSALLDALYSKNILDLEDTRDVLESAIKLLEPYSKQGGASDGTFEAEGIIKAMLLSRFAQTW